MPHLSNSSSSHRFIQMKPYLTTKRLGMRWLAMGMIVLVSGCATVPYEVGKDLELDDNLALAPDEPQFERGRPIAFLDFVGSWIFGLPSKILLLNLRVDNHKITPETEAAMAEYMKRNGLEKVKVRLNQYRPGAEWRRLAKNRAIHPGWRWTFGALATAGYTVFPGRLLGGDNYNPYTNTINLYSDHPLIAIHEAGHAKDSATKTLKGTYGAIYAIPFVPLWHEAQATGDAIGYVKDNHDSVGEKRAYRILYPAYFTYIGGSVAQFVPEYNLLIAVAAVIPGHIVGQTKALMVKDSSEQREASETLDSVDEHATAEATP